MLEVTDARDHHRHAVLVGGRHHLVVPQDGAGAPVPVPQQERRPAEDLQVYADGAPQAIADSVRIAAQVGEGGWLQTEIADGEGGVQLHRRLAALHLGALAGSEGFGGHEDLQGAPDEGPAGQPDAAGKVLWEFSHADLGYTYGEPALVKTRKHGWVLIVGTLAGSFNPVGG